MILWGRSCGESTINKLGRDAPALEYRINSFFPHVDFPQDLFDLRLPWRGGFAIDYRGEPLELNSPLPEIALNAPDSPVHLLRQIWISRASR